MKVPKEYGELSDETTIFRVGDPVLVELRGGDGFRVQASGDIERVLHRAGERPQYLIAIDADAGSLRLLAEAKAIILVGEPQTSREARELSDKLMHGEEPRG